MPAASKERIKVREKPSDVAARGLRQALQEIRDKYGEDEYQATLKHMFKDEEPPECVKLP